MKSTYETLTDYGVLPSLLREGAIADFELYCRQAEHSTDEFLRFADVCDGFVKTTESSVDTLKAQAAQRLTNAANAIETHATKVSSSQFASFNGGEEETAERHYKLAVALEKPILELEDIKELCIYDSTQLHALSTELVLRRVAIAKIIDDTALESRFKSLLNTLTSLDTKQEQRLMRLSALADTAVLKLHNLLSETESAISICKNARVVFDNLLTKHLTALHDVLLLIREI